MAQAMGAGGVAGAGKAPSGAKERFVCGERSNVLSPLTGLPVETKRHAHPRLTRIMQVLACFALGETAIGHRRAGFSLGPNCVLG